MTLTRTVLPEELDSLDPHDASAIRSRRDLKRIHRAMGTCGVLVGELQAALQQRSAAGAPLRVLELGAGDGSLMLRVARSLKALHPQWPKVQLTLLDQVDLLDPKTRAAYEAVGWTASTQVMDVLDWTRSPNGRKDQGDQGVESALTAQGKSGDLGRAAMAPHSVSPAWDLVVANLFLHHFQPEVLRPLLAAVARSSMSFVACEPRRSHVALLGSHCVGALGACRVTRADAVTSVHAGFAGQELSALWTPTQHWALNEQPARLFTHCFTAHKMSATGITHGAVTGTH